MEHIIKELFKLHKKSILINDFPVAAIIYDKNFKIISKAYNRRNKTNKTTDHAEIIAIEKANKKCSSWKLQEMYMIVTLEPCAMCTSVIKEARIKKLTYIVPRYAYKKQYKCTQFELLQFNGEEKDIYLHNIKHFFDSKR